MATKKKAAPKKAAARKPAPKKKAAAKKKAPRPSRAVEGTVEGRPSKYLPEYDTAAYKLCLMGATDKDLAEAFNVCEDTINEWKKTRSSFALAQKQGKREFDNERVVVALHERAIGYEHDEEKLFCHEGVVIRATTRKKYPPDTTAASLWLRNRDPENWRDKQDHEHFGPKGGPIPVAKHDVKLDELSDEEAAQAYLALIKSTRRG